MSDLDTVVNQEVTTDPLRSFVDALQGEDFTNAESLFKDVLNDKIQNTLDAEKVSVADEIFNGAEPVEFSAEDDESLDVSNIDDQEYEELDFFEDETSED